MISSPIDEIKNKLDIVEVISGYIKLQKAGRNYKALCPFHSEKTPSFFVSPERQIWHCFGCSAGGGIFDFVMKIEGVEFADALRILAQKAGVVLKKQNPKLVSRRQRLYEICELATKFFIKQLEASKTGQRMKKYLLERGLKEETIKEWRLGYAPESWHALSEFLKSRGYKNDEIINSGLVVQKEKSSSYQWGASEAWEGDGRVGVPNPSSQFYDRFRNRIIFPIFDLNGRVVGFAGRVLPGKEEEGAKYINTPQTLIYDKSRVLYGLDRAKTEIRLQNLCLIVEGYTDVLMSHQADIKNVVASSGTALTEQQLKIIKRHTENLALAFDMDIAGDTATKRAIDLAIEQGFNVKIIQPLASSQDKTKKDPADLIKENPDQWRQAIKEAQPIIDFYFANTFSKFDASKVDGKKEIAKIILPVLKKIPNKIEQAHWLQELARRIKINEKILVEEMKKISSISRASITENKLKEIGSKGKKSRLEGLEEELLALLLSSSETKKHLQNLKPHLFTNPDLFKIFQSLKKYFAKLSPRIKDGTKGFDLKKWQDKLPPELSLYLNQILFRLEFIQLDQPKIEEYFENCLKEIKKENLKQKLANLQQEIKLAEVANNKKKLNSFLEKFHKLSKAMAALDR